MVGLCQLEPARILDAGRFVRRFAKKGRTPKQAVKLKTADRLLLNAWPDRNLQRRYRRIPQLPEKFNRDEVWGGESQIASPSTTYHKY